MSRPYSRVLTFLRLLLFRPWPAFPPSSSRAWTVERRPGLAEPGAAPVPPTCQGPGEDTVRPCMWKGHLACGTAHEYQREVDNRYHQEEPVPDV